MCTRKEMGKHILFSHFKEEEKYHFWDAVKDLEPKLKGYIPVFGDSAAHRVNSLIDGGYLKKIADDTYETTGEYTKNKKYWGEVVQSIKKN